MGRRYIVRFGSTRRLGAFTAAGNAKYYRGQKVLIRTDRGREVGDVLCEATPKRIAMIDSAAEGELLDGYDDPAAQRRELDDTEHAREICQLLIEKHQLKMKLLRIEWLAGRELVIFYYWAEDRVDFRELVKELARRLQTRIELRQVGVRDAARLLADCGECGRACCCGNHLVQLPTVSIRMAKEQFPNLDPERVTGLCGRLKCCLRFECGNGDDCPGRTS